MGCVDSGCVDSGCVDSGCINFYTSRSNPWPGDYLPPMPMPCSLPSPLQKRSKDFKGLQRLDRCQNPAGQQRTFLGLGAPHEPIFFGDWRASCSSLRSNYFSFWPWSPGGSLRSSKFMRHTKPKEVLCWVLAPMQSIDPWISSAMAMAMSIYRTLCVLVK